jgi:SAM-dependent methyltransferase
MAITRAMVAQLMVQAQRRAFSGHVLQLGKQDIWVDDHELAEIALRKSCNLKCDDRPELVVSQFLDRKKVISDAYFFKSLGFDQVSSLDASNFEGATCVHDLNKRPLPDNLRESFDVIYDLGTLEHIFHLPNVLANIHDMLKVGGYVVHGAPCANAFQHGFYMFSPCFFFDYYRANGYELIESDLVRYKVNWKQELVDCEILECAPDSEQLALLSYLGSLDDRYYGINVTVRKTGRSTSGVIPQQGYYETIWSGQGDQLSTMSKDAAPNRSLRHLRTAFRWIEKVPFLGRTISRPARILMSRLRRSRILRWKKVHG